ncbi:MAG: glycosyltransferase family 39 protein [Bdellovibrionales bacterium]|nr:glycosyltransferase family 39 protein [Bdellovibrionales bacterium]
MHSRNLLFPILGFAFISKCVGLFSPWAGKDHYNFGGPFNSLFAKCYLRAEPFHAFALPTFCDVIPPVVYKNHPPGLLYLVGSFFNFFGEHEWVARAVPLIFSCLNVWLIALVTSEAWRGDRRAPSHAILTAFFQAIFLGSIYFGTHVDIPGEPGVTALLVSTLFALRRQWVAAGLCACLGGFFSWTGFFSVIPIVMLGFRGSRKELWQTLAVAAVAFICGLGIVAFLQGGPDELLPFIQKNLLNNKYLAAASSAPTRGFSAQQFLFQYPLVLIRSYSRMLSPFLCGLFFFGILRMCFQKTLRDKIPSGVKRALFLLGLPWLITSFIGFQYVMVHIFWFMLALPWIAMTLSVVIEDLISTSTRQVSGNLRWTLLGCCILPLALYPYGIYKFHWLHDGLNSLGYAAVTLIFLSSSGAFKQKPGSQLEPAIWIALVLITAGLNVSQTVNYRLEEPIGFLECRAQHENPAQLPSKTELSQRSLAHRYYCF